MMGGEPLYVVLLGAPGAGKGTQAARLSVELGIPHVSSGDLFRENLQNETELGKLAKAYMDKGELVPDDVTIAMVMDRLKRADCATGAILDGFPRTLPQAQALDRALAEQGYRIACAPYIRVSQEMLLARLAGRWTCCWHGWRGGGRARSVGLCIISFSARPRPHPSSQARGVAQGVRASAIDVGARCINGRTTRPRRTGSALPCIWSRRVR